MCNFVTIGNNKVFETAIHAGNEIMNVFHNCEASPLLLAEMQQGKTSTAIYVINEFINTCLNQNWTYEIFYCINLSDNILKQQTKDRLYNEAKFSTDDVEVLHLADYNNFPKNNNVDKRLIVIDECHYALGYSNKEAKPFQGFMERCGIKYGDFISKWANQNNWVLSMSATPFSQSIKDRVDDTSFSIIRLERDEFYYGLKELYNDGRIEPSHKIFDAKTETIEPWFVEKINEYESNFCIENEINQYGHMVIRATGKRLDGLIKWLEDNKPNFKINRFSSIKGQGEPLCNVDSKLSTFARQPSIILISGALRAGKTLASTKYIKMWIEPPTSETDAMLQAIGRIFGRDKHNDTFKVYANIKEIKNAIYFFDSPSEGVIPAGIGNKSTKSAERANFVLMNYYDYPDFDKDNMHKPSPTKSFDSLRGMTYSGRGKKNNETMYDVAKMYLLNDSSMWGKLGFSNTDNRNRLFKFDGLPNRLTDVNRLEYERSFQELKNSRPDLDWDAGVIMFPQGNLNNSDYKGKIKRGRMWYTKNTIQETM